VQVILIKTNLYLSMHLQTENKGTNHM